MNLGRRQSVVFGFSNTAQDVDARRHQHEHSTAHHHGQGACTLAFFGDWAGRSQRGSHVAFHSNVVDFKRKWDFSPEVLV